MLELVTVSLTLGANCLSLEVLAQIVIAAYYYFTYVLSAELVNLLLFVCLDTVILK